MSPNNEQQQQLCMILKYSIFYSFETSTFWFPVFVKMNTTEEQIIFTHWICAILCDYLPLCVCVCCHSSIDSKRMDATSFLLQLFHSCRNQSHCKKDDILNSKLTFHRQKQIAIRSKDWSAITMAVEKSGCESECKILHEKEPSSAKHKNVLSTKLC